ncbi:MAG: FtsW/RodA/SpoVE family cell cycle protein [Eubacteriales bacterium]
MVNIICACIKYTIIILMVIYTYCCFSIFGYSDIEKKHRILVSQNVVMFLFQLLAFFTLYLSTKEIHYLLLYAAIVIMIAATIAFYVNLYPDVSRLILNNMCMLISIGLVMLSRLDFDLAVKQFMVFSISMVISLFVPVIIRKARFLSKKEWRYVYAGIGIVALLLVALLAQTSSGAKLGFSIAGFSIQPSEFVKIIYVFFTASSLYYSTKFKNIVITTALAALQVLILVASTDLGAAVILYVVYLVMLYVGTKNWFYMISGLVAGSGASVVAYHLFSHIRVRVEAWQDPFATYSGSGYQVAQSLFAIGTGGWLGMGLNEGAPNTIPVAESDFIFSAIAEELGLIVGLCVILMCISCYIMFLNIAMQIHNRFYKLIALGLGTCYIFQVFLTIGGVTKFIPSTGVTLPLVSYGGSSLLSTLIMFAIIQGLYILREDEEEDIERIRQDNIRRERTQAERVAQKRPSRNASGRNASVRTQKQK